MGHERDAPFPIVEPSGARDELADTPRIFAADTRMTAHELSSRGEIEHVPVVRALAALVHRIKAHYFPVRHFGIKPVMLVIRLLPAQFGPALFVLVGIRLE